jgi:hypothetical protein
MEGHCAVSIVGKSSICTTTDRHTGATEADGETLSRMRSLVTSRSN